MWAECKWFGICRLSYLLSDWSSPVAITLGVVLAPVLSTSEPGSSGLATVASKSSILRSKAVSCVSIADAVLSPLAPTDSPVSWIEHCGGDVIVSSRTQVMTLLVLIADDNRGGW